MTASTVPLATYLLQRLNELGVSNIFGVPGDFNLLLLDYVYQHPGVEWVGCCNELNAAYAADGYGRIRGPVGAKSEPGPQLPGVLITTYGVGELSALNGVSGSFAESVPVLHIVGTTGRAIQEDHLLIHHVRPPMGLEPADHEAYMQTSKPFSCAHEFLTDPSKAAQQIDHVLTQVIKQSRPGYLYIPVDMVAKPLAEPKARLDLSIVNSSEAAEDAVVEEALEAIYAAKSPVILADMFAARYNCQDAIRELIDKTGYWSFTAPLGKGTIDENDPHFIASYNGELSLPGVADALHSSDLVINVGPMLTDSNTGAFTRDVKPENALLLAPLACTIKGKTHTGVHFVPVFKKLVARLDKSRLPKPHTKPHVASYELEPASVENVTQIYLVDALSRYVNPHDTVLIESGTFQFSTPVVKFKKDNDFISQFFYSSIGFTLPAALGAAVGRKENPNGGRTILIEGDGSAQMTIQELGTMVRQKVPMTIFLLNNDGYSIERAIWGPEQEYNDICPNWKWRELLSTFGGKEGVTVQNYLVRDRKEFEELLANKDFVEDTAKVQLVEVILDKFDYPEALKRQVQVMTKFNFSKAKDYAIARHEV